MWEVQLPFYVLTLSGLVWGSVEASRASSAKDAANKFLRIQLLMSGGVPLLLDGANSVLRGELVDKTVEGVEHGKSTARNMAAVTTMGLGLLVQLMFIASVLAHDGDSATTDTMVAVVLVLVLFTQGGLILKAMGARKDTHKGAGVSHAVWKFVAATAIGGAAIANAAA